MKFFFPLQKLADLSNKIQRIEIMMSILEAKVEVVFHLISCCCCCCSSVQVRSFQVLPNYWNTKYLVLLLLKFLI